MAEGCEYECGQTYYDVGSHLPLDSKKYVSVYYCSKPNNAIIQYTTDNRNVIEPTVNASARF